MGRDRLDAWNVCSKPTSGGSVDVCPLSYVLPCDRQMPHPESSIRPLN
jgi:hypothetical protein